MKPLEIITIIIMLTFVPLVAYPMLTGEYILDLRFHATMLFVWWPTELAFLFIASIISEIAS